MESDSESDGEERGGSLVGFLFGNVDKDMQLEDDYMDEVCLHAYMHVPRQFPVVPCVLTASLTKCVYANRMHANHFSPWVMRSLAGMF